MTKTNAIRILEAADVPFFVHDYDASDGKIDGPSVAAKIGHNAERVFKTLVATGKTKGVNVFVVPVGCELDLKKAAFAADDKHVLMLKQKDLEPHTGYVHGGCSPVGMKKSYPTFIEETAELYDTMIVSAGRVGMQVELSPEDLATVTGAVFCDLV
jgi:Cys-tRNA(Pro)/Cys-tRNA(Cys) deacylase